MQPNYFQKKLDIAKREEGLSEVFQIIAERIQQQIAAGDEHERAANDARFALEMF